MLFAQIHQVNSGLPVIFGKHHLYHLTVRCGNILPDKVCSYWEFPVTSVYKHGKLDAFGSAAGKHGIYGCPCSPACIENIVHQNYVFAGHIKGKLCTLYLGALRQVRKIISVKADINTSDRY